MYALWLSKIVLTLKDRIATAHTQTVVGHVRYELYK